MADTHLVLSAVSKIMLDTRTDLVQQYSDDASVAWEKKIQTIPTAEKIGRMWYTTLYTSTSPNVGMIGVNSSTGDMLLPDKVGAPTFEEATTEETWMAGQFGVNKQDIIRCRPGNMIPGVTKIVDFLQKDILKTFRTRKAIKFFGGSDGILAKVKSNVTAGDSTVVLEQPLGWKMGNNSTLEQFRDNSRYLRIIFPLNSYIVFYDSAGATATEMARVTGYTYPNTLKVYAEGAAGVFANNFAAATSYVYFGTSKTKYDRLPISPSPRGLRDLFEQNVGTAYMGLTPTTYSDWKAEIITGTTAGTTEDLDNRQVNLALNANRYINGVVPTLWFANPEMAPAYAALYQDQQRYAEVIKGDIGIENVNRKLFGETFKTPYWTPFCPPGKILGVNMEHMLRFEESPLNFEQGNDGILFSQVPQGNLAAVAACTEGWNWGTNLRGAHCRIDDLNVTA